MPIVGHLKSEIQAVEAELGELYMKREGLEQVLGAAIEATHPTNAGPVLCYVNIKRVKACPRGHASCGICKNFKTCKHRRI